MKQFTLISITLVAVVAAVVYAAGTYHKPAPLVSQSKYQTALTAERSAENALSTANTVSAKTIDALKVQKVALCGIVLHSKLGLPDASLCQ